MARSPLQMRMQSGRMAHPKNLSVQSGGALAGYLSSGGAAQYSYGGQLAALYQPQLGVQAGGNLAAYVSGQTGQQLTVRRGGSLASFLRRRKHPPYNPNQPRQPKGRPTGGEWMTYTAAQKAALLRRVGRGPFVPTPEMEEEAEDLDLSPFESQLSAGGVMALGAVIAGIVAAYRAVMREQQQRVGRLPGIRGGREPTLDFGSSAPQTPTATRIR